MELLMLQASATARSEADGHWAAVAEAFEQDLLDAEAFVTTLAGDWHLHKQQIPDGAVPWFHCLEDRLPRAAFERGRTSEALQRIRTEIRQYDQRSWSPAEDAKIVERDELPPPTREFSVRQVGDTLEILRANEEEPSESSYGSPVASIRAARPKLIIVEEGGASRSLQLVEEKIELVAPPSSTIEFRTDRTTLKLEPISVHPTGAKGASAMGRDQHGLWAEFTVGEPKVTHQMRWKPPGQFGGSHEEDRGTWEKHGYWQGEVPITQELWDAVIRDNPRDFNYPTFDKDYALLERWKDGDHEAGAKLVRQYFSTLHRFFSNKVPAVDVPDLIQVTLEACVAAIANSRKITSFNAYLLGIARNRVYHYYRRHGRKFDPSVYVAELIDEDKSSTMMADRIETVKAMAALRCLPLDQQLALELVYLEELTAGESAQVMETSIAEFKLLLRKAKTSFEEVANDSVGSSSREEIISRKMNLVRPGKNT